MPEKATATLTINPVGGPSRSVAWEMDAPASDRNSGLVPKLAGGNPGTATLALQPSAASKLALLAITASKYAATLKVKVTGSSDEYKMTAPVILTNPDVMAKIDANPTSFTFSNGGAEDVTVDLIAIRSN